jgi:hypothetical protein
MIKKPAILTLVCLIVSLWPGEPAGTRLDDQRSRHIGGLARAAILVTAVGVREHGGSLHEHEAGALSRRPGVVPPRPRLGSAARTFYTLPSYRIATHLSI